MRYFPVNLDLKDKPVVVIGGGGVATRKIESLLEAGARVTVVAPELHDDLATWVRQKKIRLKKRGYRSGDLSGSFAAIAATSDRPLNLKIRQEAFRRKVLLNIVDKPEFCDFVFSARIQRGEFMLTVSTGGASPALAKKVREELEHRFGDEYGALVALLGKIRNRIPPEQRKRYEAAFNAFVRSPILRQIRQKNRKGIRQLVTKYFGNGRPGRRAP